VSGLAKPTLEELVASFFSEMAVMQYSSHYIGSYRGITGKLLKYAQGVGEKHMSEELQAAFLHDVYEESKKHAVAQARRFLRMLLTYQETGEIRSNPGSRYVAPIEFCAVFEGYLAPKQEVLVENTLQTYKYALKRLANFLMGMGVYSFSDVTKDTIIAFTLSLSDLDGSSSNRVLGIFADLLNYAYGHGHIGENLSRCCMQVRYYKGDRIPATFTKEEIERTLSVIDRNTAIGKRDYAMIMIASRTGLRGRDIMDLKLGNFRFDTDTIELSQSKTGKLLVLPLTEEIGVALIDYLKNGRPDVESEFIFLRYQIPHTPMIAGFHERIRMYMELAGIPDLPERNPGYRALRHSLASNMLKANTSLYKIKEYMGHESTDTTMRYLKIDQSQLRQCALEVPPLRY